MQQDPKEFFSKHAEGYAKSDSHAHGSDLARLVELINPTSSEVALDLATGTGFTAMELSSRVKEVVAADITQEMLDQARKLANERRIRNMRFEYADACKRLPFSDSSFDIVTCRRAAHHFNNIPTFLGESARVLRERTGRLCVIDMSPQEGSVEFFNRIERLRDSTHVRAWTESEWRDEISKGGLRVIHLELLPERITFAKWLYPVAMGGIEEESIKQAWRTAPQSILDLLEVGRNKDGSVESWIKPRIILVASK